MGDTSMRFGQIEIDLARRAVLRSGKELPVPSRAFEVLVYLIEKRERTVPREELLSVVWGDVIVSDATLTQAISVLRRVVDDEDGSRSAILTVPGRGYQFTGELNDGPTNTGAELIPSRVWGRRVAMAFGALILLAAALGATTRFGGAGNRDGLSVALLPIRVDDFATAANGETLDLTSRLIGELAKRAEVRSSSSVAEFSDPRRDTPAEAGAQLGVDRVLVGYMKDTPNETLVVMELVDVKSEAVVWSDSATGPSRSRDPSREHLARSIDELLVRRLGSIK